MHPPIHELTALPLFAGIREEDLPKMLDCLGATTRHFKKNEIRNGLRFFDPFRILFFTSVFAFYF